MKVENRSLPDQKKIKETAIVISKRISAKKSDQEAIKGLMRLRYGIFDDDGKKSEKFFVEFMTKHGKISFLVPRRIYHQTKINALGILEHNHKEIYHARLRKLPLQERLEHCKWGSVHKFSFKKIATSADVAKLDW